MKFAKRSAQSLRRFGLFRILTLSLLAYIAVAVMFSTRLPPFAALEAVFGSVEEAIQEEELGPKHWIDQLRPGSGLFLHVRHTAREDSIDVQGFDFLEFDGITPESVKPFVCLTEEGKAQAQLLGLALAQLGTPLQAVSSTSCRAIETAEISVGQIDIIDPAHLHDSAIPESRKAFFLSHQRQFFENYQFDNDSITVIFGHNGLPYINAEWIEREDGEISRKQGGLSVMSWDSVSRKLTVHYTFERLTDFVMHVY